MTKRISIVTALAEKFKVIDGNAPYTSDLFDNSYPKLKFWDEVQDFPCVYLTAGTEIREYHPADFIWCFLNISVKVYVRSENEAQQQLEDLINDNPSLKVGSKCKEYKNRKEELRGSLKTL